MIAGRGPVSSIGHPIQSQWITCPIGEIAPDINWVNADHHDIQSESAIAEFNIGVVAIPAVAFSAGEVVEDESTEYSGIAMGELLDAAENVLIRVKCTGQGANSNTTFDNGGVGDDAIRYTDYTRSASCGKMMVERVATKTVLTFNAQRLESAGGAAIAYWQQYIGQYQDAIVDEEDVLELPCYSKIIRVN